MTEKQTDKTSTIYFYGNGAQLHDRLVKIPGDFVDAVTKVKQGARPVVAVTRKNAFIVDKISVFCGQLIEVVIEFEAFIPTPVSTIADRYLLFLNELTKKSAQAGVDIEVVDGKLFDLLTKVQTLASEGIAETELLRLLGIVCDTALIGPHWFVFETINACNSDCRYCNIHSPSRKPSKEFLKDLLPFEIFKSVCDDLATMGIDGITVLANGEPLLHPNFEDMIRYAKNKKFLVNFFTNGLLFREQIARTVVEVGVDELFVTISAATEAAYLALHSKQKPGDFQMVLDQFAYLKEMKDKSGSTLPKATGVHVICAANYNEVMDMAKQAQNLGFDKLRLALIRLDEHNQDLALKRENIEQLRVQLPALESFCETAGIELWEGYRFQLMHADQPEDWAGDEFVENGCFIGWGLGLIKANADASFCCVVKPITNLKNTGIGFKDLWNNPRYNGYRVAAKDLKANGNLKFTDGSRLYTAACRHCDNHDINAMLHLRLAQTGLIEFLE